MMNNNEILYDVQGLSRYFHSKRGVVKAVDDVSFQIRKGETFSLVGESGCGKTTCGRTLLGVYSKTAGKVLYHGVDKDSLSKAQQKEYLQKNHIKAAVASSTRREVVMRELEEGGLLPYFDKVICGDMVQRSKPEPDIYLEACRQIQEQPEECYAIEDSYNGIRAAKRAGLRPIMVPDLSAPTMEMEELSDCILPSLHEVQQYFEKTKKADKKIK